MRDPLPDTSGTFLLMTLCSCLEVPNSAYATVTAVQVVLVWVRRSPRKQKHPYHVDEEFFLKVLLSEFGNTTLWCGLLSAVHVQ